MAAVKKQRKVARARKVSPSRAGSRNSVLTVPPPTNVQARPDTIAEIDFPAPSINDTTIKPAETEDLAVSRGRERGSYDGDTAIKLYLREIGQVKLLTPQEEIDRSEEH